MDKFTLITGASSGIGKAFAEYYAKEKHNLILIARSEKRLTDLKQELEMKYNVRVQILCFDLSEQESAPKIFGVVKEKNIFVDTLVNCAGFGLSGNVNDLSYEKQHQQINVNVTAVFDLTKLFLKPMVEHNTGTIINVASSSGYHPIPTMAVYAASKAFVLSFTEALATECAQTNVKVLAISPGATDTNFFSAGGGVSYGNLRTPEHVVQVAINAINKGKISKIDGFNNYVTSTFLPRILPRKQMAKFVHNIMKKQLE